MSLRSEVIRIIQEYFAGSKKISELPALPTAVDNSDLIEVARNGVSYGALGSQLPSGGGGGSVTSVSVVTANGVSGSVANATTTPAITLTVQASSESQSGIVELATAAETLTGTDTVRATHPAGVMATYQNGLAAVDVTGTAISFAVPQIYGSEASPETGNVTVVTTGLVKGMTQLLIHNHSAEPTFGSEILAISGEYVTNQDNFIMLMAVSSTRVLMTISQAV